jgi:hypothetical protein
MDTEGLGHTLVQHRGEVILLDFFGWSCASCAEQARSIETDIVSAFPGQPFEVLGIDQWNGGVVGSESFRLLAQTSFPLLVTGWNVVHDYQVDLQFVVIDGNGIIRFVSPVGVLPVAAIRDTVRTYLAPLTDPAPRALVISPTADGITLRWQPAAGAVAYRVYQAATVNFTDEAMLAETPATFWYLPNPVPAQSYFRIRAVR